MPNIATALKEEVTRLARKEIRGETLQLKKAVARYRSDIADLKRRLSTTENALSALQKSLARTNQSTPKADSSPTPAVRFSAKGFRTMRDRLGLSGPDASRLLCVSVQTIYNWEAGASKPREPQLSAIAVLRKAGKREVAERLAELAS